MIRVGLLLVALLVTHACSREPAGQLIANNGLHGDALTIPLTDTQGDASAGEIVFSSRDGGHCVLCHRIDALEAEFQGDLGPDLSFVGDRLSPDQIRLRIVDYEQVLPAVTMPSYFRIHDLNQVGHEFEGQTVLTAQQVEDLVAFLSLRKENG